MALTKNADGTYTFSTGRVVDLYEFALYCIRVNVSDLTDTERRELAEYNIQQWAEWGGLEVVVKDEKERKKEWWVEHIEKCNDLMVICKNRIEDLQREADDLDKDILTINPPAAGHKQ